MKKLRKILCLFLSMLMILSINVPAFAVNSADRTVSANEETHNNEKPLSIAISTNKENYKTLGVAKITATITNTSDEDIQNVSAEAVFTDLAPVGKKSDIKKEVETLKSGESISFTYKATLNKNEHKLNIFQKIFLWLVRLFNGGFTASDNGFDNGREYVTLTNSLTFGEFSADNEVRVWYGENGDKPSVKPDTQDKTYEELIEDVDIDEVYEENEEDISTDEDTGIQFVNNIIIIDFDWDCTDERKAEIVNSINGKVVGGIEGYNELHVQVEKSTLDELESIIDELNENDDVDAEYDEISNITFNSSSPVNDPFRNGELDDLSNKVKWDWNGNDGVKNLNTSYNNWWAVASNLPGAWAYDSYFTRINIGIVDDGFDSNHEDLDLQVVSKENSSNNHGTHVAGLIGATHNNIGIAGVVKNKSLYCYDIWSSKKDKIKESEIYKGFIMLVEDYKCKVINLSIGKSVYIFNGYVYGDEKGKYPVTDKIIKDWGYKASKKIGKLLEKGYDFVVVQAAGNDGVNSWTSGYFAAVTSDNCYESKKVSKKDVFNRIIIVANAEKELDSENYRMAINSNGGNLVDIAAPGNYNYSTVAGIEEKEGDITVVASGQKYAKMGGTSMASPIVAGVAGLVWSVNPNFTGAEVKKIVLDTATKRVVKDNPSSPTTGDVDLVNAKNAVENAIKKTYGTGTVKGKVVDILPSEPKPLSNINISATEKNTNKTVCGKTEVDGTFSMVLPTGIYDIKFSKGASDLVVEDVTVSYNSSSNLGTLKMMIPLCRVSGVVKNRNTNYPVSDVYIDLYDNYLPMPDDEINSIIANEDGRFEIELSCSDDITFVFRHEDYEKYKINIDCSDTVVDLGDILLCPYGSGDEDNRKVIDSGNCGENGDELQWTLYDDGELVISGTGKMSDYSTSSGTPWYVYRNKIKTLTIKDGITSISSFAFENCTNLTKVTIPDSVLFIGVNAFSNTEYYNNTDNWTDNVLYINNHLIKAADNVDSNYNVRNGTICIADEAFYYNGKIQEVTFPDSLITIGNGAFRACWFKKLKIPNNVVFIGNYAFMQCFKIDSITIPSSVRDIGNYAFYDCRGVKDFIILNGVQNIGDYAFSFPNYASDSITIPESVICIGAAAFTSTRNIKKIKVDNKNKNYMDIDGVLFDKKITNIICYPAGREDKSYIIPDGVRNIGDSAFYDCEYLTGITIPNSVTNIGDDAFADCYRLVNITIPEGITSIGENTFIGCTALTNISIPNSVTSIGDWAFANCHALASVTMSENITSIGEDAFNYCTSLTNISIPDSVISIGRFAFDNCSSLTNISIPDSVISIKIQTFNHCSNLEKITINNPKCVIFDAENTISETATIYGYSGSTAEAYAKKYHREFVSID